MVTTGLNDETLAFKAVQEGAQDYLVKGQITGSYWYVLFAMLLSAAVQTEKSANKLLYLILLPMRFWFGI